MTPPVTKATVLFDGDCSLCNGAVRFIAANDPAGRFAFRSLQSSGEIAGSQELDTIVLLDYGKRYELSDAVLHVALGLRFPFPLAFAAILIPRPVRDAVYRWIARNRYRWFGHADVCALPPPPPPQ
jgi:predicted DCC family thiol-disulfide oxidoreductase YuxK